LAESSSNMQLNGGKKSIKHLEKKLEVMKDEESEKEKFE